MARSLHRDQSISQKNNASCIGNQRGMARRAKRNSNKKDRQFLKKDLDDRISGLAIPEVVAALFATLLFTLLILAVVALSMWIWDKL
jgi:hypothetical protein